MHKILVILIFLFFFPLSSNELRFECENGTSYKVIDNENTLKEAFYKINQNNWKKVEKFIFKNNEIEFFIPEQSYLACSDKSLPICFYSKVISDYQSFGKAKLTDVVQNDCYIGTMGCNFYNKGLVLNQVHCSVIKK